MSEFKIEKNIPFTSKKTKGSAKARYSQKYKWITELDNGDSIVCNRRQSQNVISFCKRHGIKTKQKWIDDRSWCDYGYADDGKYRVWFYPKEETK